MFDRKGKEVIIDGQKYYQYDINDLDCSSIEQDCWFQFVTATTPEKHTPPCGEWCSDVGTRRMSDEESEELMEECNIPKSTQEELDEYARKYQDDGISYICQQCGQRIKWATDEMWDDWTAQYEKWKEGKVGVICNDENDE